MLRIEVLFEDGNSLVTRFNGSIDQAESYYLGQVFNVGNGPQDNMVKCVGLRFLSHKYGVVGSRL